MTEKTKEAVKTLNKVKKYLNEEEYINILECIVEITPYPYPYPYPFYQETTIKPPYITTVTTTDTTGAYKKEEEKTTL